jgi:hypothetical protein
LFSVIAAMLIEKLIGLLSQQLLLLFFSPCTAEFCAVVIRFDCGTLTLNAFLKLLQIDQVAHTGLLIVFAGSTDPSSLCDASKSSEIFRTSLSEMCTALKAVAGACEIG